MLSFLVLVLAFNSRLYLVFQTDKVTASLTFRDIPSALVLCYHRFVQSIPLLCFNCNLSVIDSWNDQYFEPFKVVT